MARSTIVRVTCDACGCYCKDGMSGLIDVDTRLEEPEQVDLCVVCLTKGVQKWVQELPYECRVEWLRAIRKAPSV